MARSGSALSDSRALAAPAGGSTNRTFGLVFAGFFAVLAGLSWWEDGHRWPWYLGIGFVFAAVAVLAPAILAPLNRVWTAFGLLLHKIVNPLIMTIIFFGVVMPIGLLMRLLSKNPLDLEFDSAAPTYWKKRVNADQSA